MAITLPINFPVPGESAVASYSFAEVTTGQGIVEFFPAMTYQTDRILTTRDIYADTAYITSVDNDVVDVDYDITINRPLILSGASVVIQCPVSANSNLGGNHTLAITFKLIKYANAAETTLGTKAMTASITAGAGLYGSTMTCGLMTLTGVTAFGIGDVLRLSISYSVGDPGGIITWLIGTDPANRTGSQLIDANAFTLGARTNIGIPIRIDI